jgi:DNA-3-methyladenine glycosylase II
MWWARLASIQRPEDYESPALTRLSYGPAAPECSVPTHMSKRAAPARIEIEPRGPFSWDAANDVGRNFAPVSQHWRTAGAVRMAFPLDRTFEPVAVALRWEDRALRGEVAGTSDTAAVAAQVARIFSLDADGTGYPAVGKRDPGVGRLMEALPGLRPVCFTSPYETAAWGVISQRISMRQAATIRDRLSAGLGEPLLLEGVEVRGFPHPERLARLESLPGLAAEKVARLRGVAQAALKGLLDAERLRALGNEQGPASVRAIPGIGPFWASGIYLRGCGIQDVFADEPISIAALGRLHGLGDRLTAEEIERLTEPYRPYRMWVAFLLRVAVNRGLIPGVAGREMALRRASR